MTLLFILLLLAILLYPFYVIHKQIRGSAEPIERTPAEWGAEFEDISYTTDDGISLRGWWIEGRGERAVLLLHGKAGSRNGYHSGVFDLGAWYHGRGYSVMMVDLRAHGESGGRYVYFGVREHADMLGWLDALGVSERYRWALHGFSMGAVTAMMMAEKRPGSFFKVVAHAPWIDFGRVVRQELRKRASVPPAAYPLIRWIAHHFFGQDFEEADNTERCRKLCGREILYIRESEDELLPAYHWHLLKRLCPSAKVVTFEGLGHVEAFRELPHLYTEILEKEGL